MSRIPSMPRYQFRSRTRWRLCGGTRIVVKLKFSAARAPESLSKGKTIINLQSHRGSRIKGEDHMKTVTRTIYPGVTAASLRMRSLGGMGEHSRIRWGLFLLVACAGTSSAQLVDRTLAPNTAQAGIAKSLEDETGAGGGDPYTPDSSIFIINRDPFRSIRRGSPALSAQVYSHTGPGAERRR